MELTPKQRAIKAIINEAEWNYDFNDHIWNYIDTEAIEECEDTREVMDLIEKTNEDYELTNTEEIYYANAMAYLKDEDRTLTESMEIADEFWYQPKDLNSCILASLLQTRRNEEDWGEFLKEVEDNIDDYFNSLK